MGYIQGVGGWQLDGDGYIPSHACVQVGEDTPQRRQTRQRRNHRNSEVKELTEKNTN